MIDVVRVLHLVKRYSTLPDKYMENCTPVVAVACSQCTNRLRKPEYADEPAVLEAAAALSLYRLALRSEECRTAATSFSAGDVSESYSPSQLLQNAAYLRDDAFVVASPFFRDTDFLFLQV